MQYRYVVAYQLIGVIRPHDDVAISLLELTSPCVQGRLTGDIDSLPCEVDQAAAAGNLLLQGLVGQG